jgi:hypothetical protein
MRRYAGFALLLSLALLWGCGGGRTVRVEVPPRMDLGRYQTLGVVEFASNAGPAVDALATRRFQEQVQAAQPGTPFLDLGSRQAVLAAVGGERFDANTLRKIGARYHVDAVFLGEIVYSQPRTDVNVADLARLQGDVRAEMRGDMSSRLLLTASGASVWSSSSWAKREVSHVSVSQYGVSATTSSSDPREEMVGALVYHLTDDFRPTWTRRPAP